MKNAAFAFALAALVPLGFWFAGFNFDRRGDGALLCYVLTLVAFCWAFTYLKVNPPEEEEECPPPISTL